MMRPKKRYLLVAIEGGAATHAGKTASPTATTAGTASPAFGAQEAKDIIYRAVSALWGEAGVSKAALRIIAFDEKKQEAIVRCSLESLEQVIAALALCTSWRGRPLALRVKRITGIVAKLKE